MPQTWSPVGDLDVVAFLTGTWRGRGHVCACSDPDRPEKEIGLRAVGESHPSDGLTLHVEASGPDGKPGLEEDVHRFGTNPTRLLSLRTDLQPISLMPLMTAVPVTMTPA